MDIRSPPRVPRSGRRKSVAKQLEELDQKKETKTKRNETVYAKPTAVKISAYPDTPISKRLARELSLNKKLSIVEKKILKQIYDDLEEFEKLIMNTIKENKEDLSGDIEAIGDELDEIKDIALPQLSKVTSAVNKNNDNVLQLNEKIQMNQDVLQNLLVRVESLTSIVEQYYQRRPDGLLEIPSLHL